MQSKYKYLFLYLIFFVYFFTSLTAEEQYDQKKHYQLDELMHDNESNTLKKIPSYLTNKAALDSSRDTIIRIKNYQAMQKLSPFLQMQANTSTRTLQDIEQENAAIKGKKVIAESYPIILYEDQRAMQNALDLMHLYAESQKSGSWTPLQKVTEHLCTNLFPTLQALDYLQANEVFDKIAQTETIIKNFSNNSCFSQLQSIPQLPPVAPLIQDKIRDVLITPQTKWLLINSPRPITMIYLPFTKEKLWSLDAWSTIWPTLSPHPLTVYQRKFHNETKNHPFPYEIYEIKQDSDETNYVKPLIATQFAPSHIKMSPDNKYLTFVNNNSRAARSLYIAAENQASKWNILDTFKFFSRISAVAWSPNSTTVAVALEDSTELRLFKKSNNKQFIEWRKLDGATYSFLAWSPDGTKLAATHNNILDIWTYTEQGQFIKYSHESFPPADSICTCAWKNNSQEIAIGFVTRQYFGGFYFNVGLFNLEQKSYEQINKQPTRTYFTINESLCWSPDDNYLIQSGSTAPKIWSKESSNWISQYIPSLTSDSKVFRIMKASDGSTKIWGSSYDGCANIFSKPLYDISTLSMEQLLLMLILQRRYTTAGVLPLESSNFFTKLKAALNQEKSAPSALTAIYNSLTPEWKQHANAYLNKQPDSKTIYTA